MTGIDKYERLQLGAAPAGNMFHRKRRMKYSELSNVFGIADNILIEGHDHSGEDHDRILHRKEHLKLPISDALLFKFLEKLLPGKG